MRAHLRATGPATMLDYLSRHTHRTAIGNERLVGIDGDRVRLRVRADDSGGKRAIAMDGQGFIARFLQHVLPRGFKRIRHYGLLAPAAKTQRLAPARQLLAMPQPTRRRARTRRLSCGVWHRSRSRAARIAQRGTGGCWRTGVPAARRSQASPRADAGGHRDRLGQPNTPCKAWLRTQAGVGARRARQSARLRAPQAPCGAVQCASGAVPLAWLRLAAPCAARRACPRAPLKLTLPIPPPARRSSPTRSIRRHAALARSVNVGSAADKRFPLRFTKQPPHMRFEGTLTSWNDERGFGRIESTQGGEPIFVHVSAWPRGTGRPQLNQLVSFEVELSPKGKRARNVQLVQSRRALDRIGRRGPAQWGTVTLFSIPAFLLLYTVVDILWKPPLWVAGWYLFAGAVTFLTYAADKSAAARGRWRTAEFTLHMLSLVGGWPGALLAQQFLRHKSSKQEFRQVFWATVALNCVALVVLVSPMSRLVLGA